MITTRGVATLNDVLHGGVKVVKHVLLVEAAAGVVPRAAKLAAAAQIGDGENAAKVLAPDKAGDGKRRRQRNVEAAVAVEQQRRRAVRWHAARRHHKHWYCRAIFRLVYKKKEKLKKMKKK